MGANAPSSALGGASASGGGGGASASGLYAGTSARAPSGAATTPGPEGGATSSGATGGAGGWALLAGGESAPTTGAGATTSGQPNGGASLLGPGGTLVDVYVRKAGDTMTGLLTTPSGPLQTSTASGNTLTWDAAGLYVPPPPERGTLQYRYSTNPAMADPGSGFARSNADTGPATTALAFDAVTDGGADASQLLRALRAGDGLYIQDKDDSTKWVRHTVSGAALDHTGWFEVPVAFLDGSGTPPGNNERLDVTFTLLGATGEAGEQDYARLVFAPAAPPAPAAPSDAFWCNPEEVA